MDLLDRLRAMALRTEAYGAVAPGRHLPGTTTVEAVLSPTEVVMNGRRTLMFGSNNYFGLTGHPEVLDAAHRALDEHGAGTTGSRIANGSYAIHRSLERDFAAMFGKTEAVIFTTGYQANLAIIGALCGPGDTILLDAESHASLCDGARLSGADVMWVQHNSPANLATKLSRLPDLGRNRLVVVEGLYSIRGDVAALGDIVAVCREHGAYVLVDEAHSFGLYGDRGLGCAEAQGVLGDVDFVVGTFSKALGGIGGFCVSNHPELEMLRLTARAYMFTASSTPANVAAASAALALIKRDRSFRDRLWTNLRAFRDGLHELGFATASEASPIIPVFVGPEDRTLALWEGLLEAGVYVNVVVPPACSVDQCLLRTSCSASHTAAEIKEALEIFDSVGRRLGVIGSSVGARRV